jgi:glycosyltransferase involved in cell wall biosynthesis
MNVMILGIGSLTRDFARNWPEPVLARALMRRGHQVSAVGYLQPEHASMNTQREMIDGIAVARVRPSIWPGGALARALDTLPRPDVLHIFHLRNVLVWNAVAWARKRRIPIVHSPVGPFHDAYLVDDRERPYSGAVHYERLAYDLPGLVRALLREPKPRRQLTNYLLHAPLRRVDRYIASSRHEQEILQRMGIPVARSEVIPLWIEDAPPIEPDRSVLAGLGDPIVLFIGQLTPRKGFDLLVEAIPAIAARHPAASVVFVSHNPASQAQMLQRAEALGVAGSLRFVGRVSEAQKAALMQAAACLVVPSRYEGFGLPLLEAMQAGVPLVASNIPVIDEIVTDGRDGLLVAPENPEALGYGIGRLLDDPALRVRLAAAGRATLAERFDEDDLLARVLACYTHAGARP